MGALIAGSDGPVPLPPGTEHRLAGFAELDRARLIGSNSRR